MSQEHSSPPGPPRGSTSIDQLMEQSGAEPVADALPPELTGRKGRKAAKGAKAPLTPEKQLSGLRVFFVACFAVVLVTGVLVFDEVGPSVDRSARVTERYIERKSKGGKDYVIEGVDDRGGEFEVDVSKSTHGRVDVGDRVVITRSVLTGRVIEIDGPGWSDGRSSWKFWVWGVFGGLAVLGVWWTLRMMRRTALPNVGADDRTKHMQRMALWMAAAVAGVTAWVFYERADANVDAGGAKPGTVVATDPATEACDGLPQRVSMWAMAATLDSEVTAADVDTVVSIVEKFQPGCSRVEITSAVCDELEQRVVSSITPLEFVPASVCAGR